MIKTVIRLLGLKGSWKWACKRMDDGFIVFRKTYTGAAKYKLDDEGQRRIVWAFTRNVKRCNDWESANIFLSDFSCTDWEIIAKPDVAQAQGRDKE